MADPWFYLSSLPDVGEVARIGGDEARHASGAKRLREGETLVLFNGKGHLAQATIENLDARSKSIDVRIQSRDEQLPPQPFVHLACALPKGDRQSTLISMAVQLGMSQFTPLECERSVVKANDSFQSRADRIALEACKQAQRAHLPMFLPARSLEDALTRLDTDTTILIVHPGGQNVYDATSSLTMHARICILIGSEGGFTDKEVSRATDRGATCIDLGPRILRIETASVAALCAIMLR